MVKISVARAEHRLSLLGRGGLVEEGTAPIGNDNTVVNYYGSSFEILRDWRMYYYGIKQKQIQSLVAKRKPDTGKKSHNANLARSQPGGLNPATVRSQSKPADIQRNP